MYSQPRHQTAVLSACTKHSITNEQDDVWAPLPVLDTLGKRNVTCPCRNQTPISRSSGVAYSLHWASPGSCNNYVRLFYVFSNQLQGHDIPTIITSFLAWHLVRFNQKTYLISNYPPFSDMTLPTLAYRQQHMEDPSASVSPTANEMAEWACTTRVNAFSDPNAIPNAL
jgi:hypothetical protein